MYYGDKKFILHILWIERERESEKETPTKNGMKREMFISKSFIANSHTITHRIY